MTSKKHKQAIDAALSSALEPPRRRPSPQLDSVLSEYAPPQAAEQPQPAPPTVPTPRTAGTPATAGTPVAPARDFQRVANSIVREAVPAGVFAGKSKLIYDYLYSKTRGAVVPVRSVRVTKEQLMLGAGVGSERTLYKNLRRLTAAGLVRVLSLGGEHAGSEYTVFLPEEARQPTPPTPPTAATHASHKVQSPPTAQSGVSGVGLTDEAESTSGERKTSSFKTNTIDDDEAPTAQALSDHNSIFSEAVRKLTGRAPRASEREQWAELARVLVEELNEAASRAESVSSVPAFLAAHLRRKLAPRPATRKREGNQKPDVGAPISPPPDPNRRLTEEEIAEQARVIAEVIEGGYTMEQAEAQFGASFNLEDWTAIKRVVLVQGATKRGKR